MRPTAAEPQPGSPEWDALPGITAKEILLLETIHEHLKRLIEALTIGGTDSLSVVLRVHIILQVAITEKVKEKLVHPEALESENAPLEYQNLVRFARALGILNEEFYNFARELGHLRNKFAHRFGRVLTDGDLRKLVKHMQQSFRNEPYKSNQARLTGYVGETVSHALFHGFVQENEDNPRRRFEIDLEARAITDLAAQLLK